MTKPTKASARKKSVRSSARKPRSVETFGLLQIRSPINLHLKLSPSGVRGARASLESARGSGFHSGTAQLRLDVRDLKSICLCLGPAQAKKLVARLKALELGAQEVSR